MKLVRYIRSLWGIVKKHLRAFIILSIVFIPGLSFGQPKESEMYRAAYQYLDSINKLERTARALRDDCQQYVQGTKLRFKDNLQVASKFIENDRGFPLCDLLKRKYGMKESCVYALGSGESELTKHVQDSLMFFWQDYQMRSESSILESLRGIGSKRKDGFLVFFSDIYKNTLAAEVKSFCRPYDKIDWQGSSTSYFFVFNSKGVITEVFSGIETHYN